MSYLASYLITAFLFLGLDFVWLSVVAKSFYFDRLQGHLLAQPKLGAAAGFYAVYVIGVIIFAVAPAMRDQSVGTALLYGALFGFFAYATYDMTNYATLKDWPVSIVLVDIAWGTVLTAVSAGLGYWLSRMIVPN